MKSTLISTILLISTTSCNILPLIYSQDRNDEPEQEVIKARITYYCGLDKWGDRVADPNTKRAKEGITVAAHPDFSFGTEVFIPELEGVIGDGNFIVQDRGGAVKRKVASQGKAYVFDVFVTNITKLRRHANKNSMYMDVILKTEK